MIELPLFPLNLVLFPGMPLSLHIFEERYKQMINRCIEKREPFGVVLISNSKIDTNPLAEPCMIGCTAHITQVQPLDQGRMNITVIGKERFQIISLHHDKPYLTGMVEMLPMEEDSAIAVRRGAASLRVHVNRYLEILQKAGQIQFNSSQLPKDPTSLTYLAAVLIQNISPEQKQELLEFDQMTTLISHLCTIYRVENVLLDVMLSPPDHDDFKGIFSLN